jgi:hypothetical protein
MSNWIFREFPSIYNPFFGSYRACDDFGVFFSSHNSPSCRQKDRETNPVGLTDVTDVDNEHGVASMISTTKVA